jgi:hypothetical protein
MLCTRDTASCSLTTVRLLTFGLVVYKGVGIVGDDMNEMTPPPKVGNFTMVQGLGEVSKVRLHLQSLMERRRSS